MIEATFDRLLRELDAHTGTPPPPVAPYREALKNAAGLLAEQFQAGTDVVELVHARARFVDSILHRAWQAHVPADADASLIAVGGYGRGELHPASDVDVLILTATDPEPLAAHIEPLVMFLWDIGLEIGHSVRSLDQCVAEARKDLTIATNVMESRCIAGRQRLFEEMTTLTGPAHIWPSDAFFAAKMAEQEERHRKANDSSQDLEPNIKNNPGGLRDNQTIGWVAKRYFGATRLSHLKQHGFLTEKEDNALKQGEHLLWEIRFALHLAAGRREDRFLFEHQRTLARQFGYGEGSAAVEALMQRYYRTTLELQRLHEMLLQLFQEAILQHNQLGRARPINRRFQERGGYLEAINPATFARSPLSMLEVFLLLQQHPELKGVRATTIRAIRAHRHLVDKRLRRDIRARSLFMEILRQPAGITHELRCMHRYGILARYIPAFRQISGLMQFDLFHVYTVDEHILMVVRNLRRFMLPQHAEECRLCHELAQRIPKPELLYLAGLFHDIAKGRGGDHSHLGAEDTRLFCRDHGLSAYDTDLVAWLVERHLLMSTTAQRKDIDDPDVITEFARITGSVERLSYLYLLTVADMRGTNPAIWNAWKGALLATLYQRTRQLLEQGPEQASDEDSRIQAVQDLARAQLLREGFATADIHRCWMDLSTDYFLQTPADAIAWHTGLLLQHLAQPHSAHVFAREDPERGCVELFSFAPDRDGLFADTAATLDRMGLDILGARIDTTSSGVSVNSYFVLEVDGSPLTAERQREVAAQVQQGLNQPSRATSPQAARIPRRLRAFECPTRIDFVQNEAHAVTELNLVTQDRPGLLSLVGSVLAQQELRMHAARVLTEGAVARDRFTLTDLDDRPILDSTRLSKIRESLTDVLSEVT